LKTVALDGVYSSLLILDCLEFTFAVGNAKDPLIKTFTFEEKEEEESVIKGGQGRVLSWSAGEAFTLLESGAEDGAGLGASSMMVFGDSLIVGGCDGKIRVWQNIKEVVGGGGGWWDYVTPLSTQSSATEFAQFKDCTRLGGQRGGGGRG
jgi:hypothetical protein